ncbi:MAG: TetR/AcrR family transcriptional regulator [Microbacterium sp.]
MVGDGRAPRMRPATAQRRRQILEASFDVFAAKGYANGTLQDIADRLGMTHAGILHHFGSKDQLLIEMLEHRDRLGVTGYIERRDTGAAAVLRELVRTAAQNAQQRGIVQAYAVFAAESVTDDHPGREFFERRYRSLRQEVVVALRALCAERGIDEPKTVDRAASSVLAAMDGLQVQWLLTPAEVDLAEASEFAINAIVNAVLYPLPSAIIDELDED